MLAERPPGAALTGSTPAICHARWLIERVAQTTMPVLLSGEVGVGKALAAREIHRCSRRRGQLVTVQCATIGDADVDSALFGAPGGDGGYLQAAASGTLVFDEITDLSPGFQARLLELLKKEGLEAPAGALNTRVIATTHKPLPEIEESRQLRPELYYELCAFPIALPPLRERRDDIAALVDALSAGFESGQQQAAPRFDAQALAELKRYAWPGNVQELANLVERLAILYPQTTIDRHTLEANLRPGASTRPSSTADVPAGEISPATQIAAMTLPEDGVDLRSLSESLEKHLIEQALARHDHVVTHAARALGLRRTTLTEKLRRYAIRTH